MKMSISSARLPGRYQSWFRPPAKPPRRAGKTNANQKRYLAHREAARRLVKELLAQVNRHYGLAFGRVAIRNQRRSWGSCSSAGNLNFNYRILFLPPPLQEYIVAHELCHLAEFNHGPDFWRLVASAVPDYRQRRQRLRELSLVTIIK